MATSPKGGGTTGPAAHYRPKDPRPITVALTTRGIRILVNVAKRTGASRGDIMEQLLRRFGVQVEFPEPKEPVR